nr:glycogen/starch/alpha-glucan phosphorylase [Natranaerovirga pectinivora]
MKSDIKENFIEKLKSFQGKSLEDANNIDKYRALSGMVRDELGKRWVETNSQYNKEKIKQVYYLSIEFLLGKLLISNLINLDLYHNYKEALEELGINIDEIEEIEPDAGLGNGGLGRLAACFLDSMATLGIPGHGCGIRYKYGLFDQRIVDGQQVEYPDNWLKDGSMWEYRKQEKEVEVKFYGNFWAEKKDDGYETHFEDYQSILAVPYDIPIAGYKNNTVNTLRLWSAEVAENEFDFSEFNKGDYLKAVEYSRSVEAISEILYPDDNHYQGKELRLKQQYFFVSASIQSIINRCKKKNQSIAHIDELVAIHINDTHPAIAIAELMRILMDDEGFEWNDAWRVTTNTISYTNHTIMPEALEKWPIDLFKNLLPRIYHIIEEINKRFIEMISIKYPDDLRKIKAMSIIEDGQVKMANLAIIGSNSVNGVAKIHSEILKKQVFKDFYDWCPFLFNNKTNGITHRRWLIKSNPELSDLITRTIGNGWIDHPIDLGKILKYEKDSKFQKEISSIKYNNKVILAKLIEEEMGIKVNPKAIFDVHIKRIHSYKRQLLNLFHIIDLYNRLKENPNLEIHPRVFIFGGKAAQSYYIAKETIKLIHSVAEVINNDEEIEDKIKVIFLENYRVSLAEKLFPAADVSEQISTASKEASGTGNMKFMMNGAVTIGTMDGANIEILEEVGEDNIIIFGLSANEVMDYYHNGGYNAWEVYNSDIRIKRIMDSLVDGTFSKGQKDKYRNLFNYLLINNDEYFVLKDFDSYIKAQNKVEALFKDRNTWNKMCINNIARSGKFSSDRTINEYSVGIWKVAPFVVKN